MVVPAQRKCFQGELVDAQKLGVVFFFVVLLAGSFGAGYRFLQPTPDPVAADITPRPAARNDLEPAPKEEPKEQAQEPVKEQPKQKLLVKTTVERRPASRPEVPIPLSAAEVARFGAGCVGARVTWIGKWIHSQSSGKASNAQHIFESAGGGGDFSFDFPFIVADSKPLDRPVKGSNIKEFHDRRWGPTRIVTVTGTIDRLEKLIFIGRGTREQVPVLTEVMIRQ